MTRGEWGGIFYENPWDSDADPDWLLRIQCRRASSIKLQSMRRPAARLHEELCRPDMQVRVSDVHEILREEIVRLFDIARLMLAGSFDGTDAAWAEGTR
jgi:hypothetical protein